MTDESGKPKKRQDPQQMYADFCERQRDNPTSQPNQYSEIDLRDRSMRMAVDWMVGKQSTPRTDLIALADRIYRFIRFMPDQELPKE